MLVPDAWNHSTRAQHETSRQAPKRQRTSSASSRAAAAAAQAQAQAQQQQPHQQQQPRAGGDDATGDVVEGIRNAVSNARELPLESEAMRIDCILSALPYRKIIEDVFTNCAAHAHAPDVALVTRAYEESYMRESQGPLERPCVMGANCECMHIDRANRFVGTEFLLPGDPRPPQEPRMCVLCNRQVTQKLFFDLIFDGRAFCLPIQKYGNICDQPGEYAREVMLVCPPGGPVHVMPYPVVAHQRNRYAVATHHGTRCLRQLRVSPEDYAPGGSEDARVHRISTEATTAAAAAVSSTQAPSAAAGAVAFSAHPALNAELAALHTRLLGGDPDAQVEIDGYIVAELLLRDPATRARLERALAPAELPRALHAAPHNSMRVQNLPDLGAQIRLVVFLSGGAPLAAAQLPNLLVYTLIYEALPNIKRTKQVRHAERAQPQMGAALGAACVSVLAGTLLGLFEHAAKRPGFAARCDIVAQLHAAQCLAAADKHAWLLRVPNLARLAFMEYVTWFIGQFMPVEAAIIATKQSTALYLKTYKPVCDSFRQSITELAEAGGRVALDALDAAAAQHIDRCMRICKFKMVRHAAANDSYALETRHVAAADLRRVLDLPVLAVPQLPAMHRRGRGARCRDITDELHIVRPELAPELLRLWGHVQQLVTVAPLPANLAAAQLAAVRRRFRNCDERAAAARRLHLCMACCLRHRAPGTHKFRLGVTSGRLECAGCGPDGGEICSVDVLGRVVYYAGDAFFLCCHCARVCIHTAGGVGLAEKCARCAPPPPPPPPPPPRPACARCESTNVYLTMRLFDAAAGAMRAVHLCFKHAPGARARADIVEVSQVAGCGL